MNKIVRQLTLLIAFAALAPVPALHAGGSGSKQRIIRNGALATALLSPVIVESAMGMRLNLKQLALLEAMVAAGSYLVARYNVGTKPAEDAASRVGVVGLFYAIANVIVHDRTMLKRYGIPALAYLLLTLG